MEKLTEQSEKNSNLEYDKIYLKRKETGPNEQDVRRWKRLLKHYRGGRIIDLGCLDSLVPALVHERFPKAEVWGIDLAEEAIAGMKMKYPLVYFEVGDVYKTKYPADYFSYAVAGELIEHLERPEDFIKEAMRILRPGGTLALSTPKEEAIEVGAVDKDRHLWSFSSEDLESLLNSYGEVSIDVLGSRYFPIYAYHWPSLIAYCKKHAR